MSNSNWYLLQFKPNSQKIAERNLNQQSFKTFLPTQEVTKRKNSRFIKSECPLFPGYMFVAFDEPSSPWYKINRTYGVSRIVNFSGKPASVPAELMSELFLLCDAGGKILPKKKFNVGEQVKIMSGPFSNYIASIEKLSSDQRVWILMQLLGQKSKLQININELTHYI
jgi:transcriptional antiterminator RfaH